MGDPSKFDPLELLTNKESRQSSFLSPFWNPMLGGVFGVGAALFSNWGIRKPVFSGIQKHILFGIIGVAAGTFLDNQRTAYLAKRDAILRHYVELHPEDFPVTDRQKYGQVLEAWVPIR